MCLVSNCIDIKFEVQKLSETSNMSLPTSDSFPFIVTHIIVMFDVLSRSENKSKYHKYTVDVVFKLSLHLHVETETLT